MDNNNLVPLMSLKYMIAVDEKQNLLSHLLLLYQCLFLQLTVLLPV